MANKWGRRYISLAESILSSYGFVYTFITLYMVTNILLFINGAVDESHHHDDIERYTTAIARGSGATINFNMAVVLLLASRSMMSLIQETPLNMVLPIDKAMPELHRVVGILVVFSGSIHSICHWITYILKRPWSPGYAGKTSLFISGMILLFLIITIRFVARPAIYQASYEVFFRIHVGGSILAFITIIIHGLHLGTPNTWKWVLGPIIIYVLDIVVRTFREKRSYLLLSKHSAAFQGRDIVKIRLPRVFHFQAGQYAELKIPQLSAFQWHPFTIASAPHEPELIFYIKAVGNWTISLHELFGEKINNEDALDIEIHIRGPYGAPAQHFGQFDRVILVGGGVGATPFCSVAKHAYNWITNWTPRNKKRTGRERQKIRNLPPPPSKSTEEERPSESSEGAVTFQEEGNNDTSGDHDITENYSSHLFTTNVYSENLESLGMFEDLSRLDVVKDKTSQKEQKARRSETEKNDEQHVQEDDDTTVACSSLYTARDYLMPLESSSSESTKNSTLQSSDSSMNVERGIFQVTHEEGFRVTVDGLAVSERKSASRDQERHKFSNRFSRSSVIAHDEGMGSYHENSSGTCHRSLDYMSALYSAYSEESTNEVFQQSLDLLVSMSFGSVSLVRNMQRKKVQRRMRQPPDQQVPISSNNEDLSLFHNPKVMLLLFMKSVTMNMLVLWIVIIQFIIAGTASIFDELLVLDEGLALYSSTSLIYIDLILSLSIMLLVGFPTVIEMYEVGIASTHGIDIFVLIPATVFGTVVDAIALLGMGRSVKLFSIFHVFVLWPVLAILILIRLLRIIGERISQAENISKTHTSTKAVDFFWTAPTPEDDQWLVSELTPYTDLKSVQMHRYLTRYQAVEEGKKAKTESEKTSLHTYYGRPKWMTVFNGIAEQCENNSTIGVFFCGPHAMGAEVQDACKSAMRNSIIRGLHSRAQNMRGLEEVFGEAVLANEYTGEASRDNEAGTQGCNVKLIFRRESFA